MVGCAMGCVDATACHDQAVVADVGRQQRHVGAQAKGPLELDGVQQGELVHPGCGEDELSHALDNMCVRGERAKVELAESFFRVY